MLIESGSLTYGPYHRHLHRQFPNFSNSLFPADQLPDYINPVALLGLMGKLRQHHDLFYLHPSFGYYFELFHAVPLGLIYQLHPYELNSVAEGNLQPPRLPSDVIIANRLFWGAQALFVAEKLERFHDENRTAKWLGSAYSMALNYWGVELQKANLLEEAHDQFLTALRLNPDNLAALINQKFNRRLTRHDSDLVQDDEQVTRKLAPYRSIEDAVTQNGPFDAIQVRLRLGNAFLEGGNLRQGTAQFARVLEVDPRSIQAHLGIISGYLAMGFPDKAIEQIATARAQTGQRAWRDEEELEITRMEAQAYAMKKDFQIAEELLLSAQTNMPEEPRVADLLAQFYLQTGRFDEAIQTTEQLLKRHPANKLALLNLASIHIQMGQNEKALAALNRLLQLEPGNPPALMNRAAAYINSGRIYEAQQDYQSLLEQVPERPYLAYIGLAEVAEKRNETKEAIKYYKLYLETAPKQTEEYLRVSTRLGELQNRTPP